jgi:hypothetical protein
MYGHVTHCTRLVRATACRPWPDRYDHLSCVSVGEESGRVASTATASPTPRPNNTRRWTGPSGRPGWCLRAVTTRPQAHEQAPRPQAVRRAATPRRWRARRPVSAWRASRCGARGAWCRAMGRWRSRCSSRRECQVRLAGRLNRLLGIDGAKGDVNSAPQHPRMPPPGLSAWCAASVESRRACVL